MQPSIGPDSTFPVEFAIFISREQKLQDYAECAREYSDQDSYDKTLDIVGHCQEKKFEPTIIKILRIPLFCDQRFSNSICLDYLSEWIGVSEMRFPIEWSPDYATRAEIFLQYAEVYKEAVEVLLVDLQNRVMHHDYQILPTLFLFRHYIELQLKGLILYNGGMQEPTHNISVLLDRLQELDSSAKLPNSSSTIRHLNQIDVGSDAFRYPEDKDMRRFFQTIGNEEFYDQITRLSSLKETISTTIGELENLETHYNYLREHWSNSCQELMQ